MNNLLRCIQQSSFYVKWTNWEYYPVSIANIPTVLFWLYFAIRSRSLFFFTVVNPVIETGGVMGESKINIFNRLPGEVIPNTLYIKKGTLFEDILKSIKNSEAAYPLIAKPNIGERGFLVEKINDEQQLAKYHDRITVDFLIQDFIDYPVEISVLYYRFPNSTEGKITSLCVKKTLEVIGDGTSTIEMLMQEYPRARFQLERFRKDFPALLSQLPNEGERVELEPIGNHSRGTTFLNGNMHINKELEKVFDSVAMQMEGIYYGRFDMKCASLEKLQEGKSFKILEFNGIASEPAHIYDPSYSTLQGYKDIFKHWKIIYEISKIQMEKGLKPMNMSEAFQSIKTYLSYMKSANI